MNVNYIRNELPRLLRREWGALRRRKAPWVTGIDLDGDCLRLAQIQINGKKARLKRTKTVVFRNPGTGQISEEARRTVRQWQVVRGRVVTFMPRDKVTVKRISLPSTDIVQLRQMAPFEASRFLPYPPDELLADLEIITKHDDGNSDVSLVAVTNGQVEEYLTLFEALGLEPDKIEISSTALSRILETPTGGEAVSVCLIGKNHVDVVIRSATETLFSRGVSMDAEASGLDAQVDEVVRSLEYGCQSQSITGPVKITVLSDPEQLRTIASRLETRINGRKDLAGLFDLSGLRDQWKPTTFSWNESDGNPAQYAAAIGAALDPSGAPNLVPTTLMERRRLRDRIRTGVSVVFLACLGLFLLALTTDRYLDSLGKHLQEEEKKWSDLRNDVRDLQNIKRQMEAVSEHINPKSDLLEVYVDLYTLTPTDVVLSSVSIAKGVIKIQGQAAVSAGVWKFMSNMSASNRYENAYLEFTKPPVSETNVRDFSVTARIKEPQT